VRGRAEGSRESVGGGGGWCGRGGCTVGVLGFAGGGGGTPDGG